MKKISVLLMLFTVALLVTPLYTASNFNELFNEVSDYNFRTETKINVQEEVVGPDLYTTATYENEAVLACSKQQDKPRVIEDIYYLDMTVLRWEVKEVNLFFVGFT